MRIWGVLVMETGRREGGGTGLRTRVRSAGSGGGLVFGGPGVLGVCRPTPLVSQQGMGRDLLMRTHDARMQGVWVGCLLGGRQAVGAGVV